MNPRHPRPLDAPRFALLEALVRRMTATEPLEQTVREAVDILTADVDPNRARRLAVRRGEPAVLVERLAVWALHRASDDAVRRANAALTGRDCPADAAVRDFSLVG